MKLSEIKGRLNEYLVDDSDEDEIKADCALNSSNEADLIDDAQCFRGMTEKRIAQGGSLWAVPPAGNR